MLLYFVVCRMVAEADDDGTGIADDDFMFGDSIILQYTLASDNTATTYDTIVVALQSGVISGMC